MNDEEELLARFLKIAIPIEKARSPYEALFVNCQCGRRGVFLWTSHPLCMACAVKRVASDSQMVQDIKWDLIRFHIGEACVLCLSVFDSQETGKVVELPNTPWRGQYVPPVWSHDRCLLAVLQIDGLEAMMEVLA